MNSNIFKIQQEYLNIVDEIEANDGELSEELEERLAINEENRDEKMEAYVAIIKQKKADIDLAKNEIERLSGIIQSSSSTIDRLKDTLLEAMVTFDLRNEKGNYSHRLTNTLLFTRRTEAVEIFVEEVNEELINEYGQFFNFDVKKLDKVKLDKIKEVLGDIEYAAIISKTKFKEYYLDILNNPQLTEDEREQLIINTEKFGAIVNNTSLTIK
jgi:hypothetical protein